MSETKFMWQGGRKIAIEADPNEVTIHAPDERTARELTRSAGVSPRALWPMSPGLVRAELPDRDADMARLREDNQVVHHVYRASADTSSEFLITESFFLKFKPDTSDAAIRQYLQAEHLQVEQDLGDKTFLVRVTADTGKNPVRTANAAAARPDVEYAEPNLVRKIQRMFTPADPEFVKQWHLHAPSNDGDVVAGAGVFAPEAWDTTLGSRQIVIAVADDGFDLSHPDFQGAGKIAGKLNIQLLGLTAISWDEQVGPRPGDYHGTPCAGVALAEHNGSGTIGVAPGCALLAVRFPLAEMSDAQFIRMFDAISTRADVVSCSWGVGPADAPMSTAFATRLEQLALTGGRRGKGLVMCVAAGNNNAPIRDLANRTPYQYVDGRGQLRSHAGPIDRWIAAHPAVITVSASTSQKRRAAYSSWGPEVSVCAPSNNFHDLYLNEVPGRGIFTTDNEGAGAGSDFTPNSRFTPDFGGTSSATPTVAGVCGLVLSANPMLTAGELRAILERTADKDLVIASDTPVNVPGAFKQGVSPWFGKGKVNAAKAVAAASLGQQTARSISGRSDRRLLIADLHTVTSELSIPEPGQILDLRVKVKIAHTYVGDLRVELRAPDGSAVLLHDRAGGGRDNLATTYDSSNAPGLRALAGRELRGVWKLCVRDAAQFDSGELQGWELSARIKGG